MSNKELISDFLNAFSTGDVDKVVSYLADDLTWWVPGEVPGISGTKDREGLSQLLTGISSLTTTGALTLTPTEFTIEGNRVAVETESYAELKNGRVYANRYHFLFVLDDNGKIRSVKEYMDTQHTASVFAESA